MSVEGPADEDTVTGEEIIDVAEYFGGINASSAMRVRYHQLKHSSVRIDGPITSSELSKTLRKFAGIYREAKTEGRQSRTAFNLVTNRTLGAKVRETLTDLAEGRAPAHDAEATYIRNDLGFGSDAVAEQAFCRQFSVEDGTLGVTDVERVLEDELKGFIPGGGTGAELAELMHKISGMATQEARTHTLERSDLLVTLRTTEHSLFPAMPEFEDLEHVIRTRDVDTISNALRTGPDSKFLLTALGGVGKSIFTGMLKNELAGDSLTLVFDCFAGGNYRRITSRRHLHKVALTQLANELASKGLCSALIPSQTADPGDYTRTFVHKVQHACERLALRKPDAILTVVIDAADNAAMAAAEFDERHFVNDLFREDWPANLRLIALCRPERTGLLDLPNGVREMDLVGFDQAETLTHLRTRFLDATASQGAELHILSSGNPRVQAMAMEGAGTAAEAISALEIARNRPGEALDTLLAAQIQKVAAQGHLLPQELTRLCQALATLHPTIPLADLAAITDLSVDTIRSFAVALGRGLHFNNNSLQFRDEPTETWFRSNHSLNSVQMREFAIRVAPQAAGSAYIAAVLPQLYFEARMVDELVQLALSDTGLPAGIDDLQAQEIARARARFALGATLRAQRNTDAALLAVKAGTLSSGRSRRIKLFRTNPDLAARYLDTEIIESLCTGRELAYEWPGSNLHVEATMLSGLPAFRDLARTRFTSSFNNISAVLRLNDEAQRRLKAQIGPAEIADLALTATNLDGPVGGFEFLARWRPNDFVRETTAKFASRLADAARTNELSELLVAAESRKHIQLAVIETMFEYGIVPSGDATAVLIDMLMARRKPFKHERGPYVYEVDLRGVTWALLHGLRLGLVTDDEALRILEIHLQRLPNHVGESWHGLPATNCLVGHALKARLRGTELTVEDVVSPDFFKELSKNTSADGRDTRSFNANIPALLPWVRCFVDAVLDGPTEAVVHDLSSLAAADLRKVHSYDTPFVRVNGVAETAIRILAIIPDESVIEQFAAWHRASDESLSRSRRTIARCCARNPKLASLAIEVVNRGLDRTQLDRTDADLRVDELIELARAVLATSPTEARAIFNTADQEAKLVGDDLPARWYAMTNTARALGTGLESERAYRLLQVGETLDTGERSDVSQLANPLYAMHPPSYYTAVSRQRDRRAISFDRLLEPVFRSAAQPGGRIGALAVYAFGPGVPWKSVTENLPAEEAAKADRIYAELTKFERAPGEVPDELRTNRSWPLGKSKVKKPKPAKVVARFDFTSLDSWDAGFKKIGWYTAKRKKFVQLALRKSPAALPDALTALAAAQQARAADFVIAAELASEQPTTAGLRAALTNLADTFADRFTAQISTRWYDRTELHAFAAAAGADVNDLMRRGFISLGDKAHTLTYDDYFSLASHIARTLSVEDAGKIFDALSEVFNDLAPPDTAADGPYEQLPAAPAETAQCLAGLIWASLGDMAARHRWDAAHAVLLLVQLGDAEVLEHLSKYADKTHDSKPFRDKRFQPYDLHSQLWLLLALDRAASEPNAKALEPFVPWLVALVDGAVHAANQVMAQRVLQTLSTNGTVALDAADMHTLTKRLQPEWDELGWKQQRERPDPLDTYPDPDLDSGGIPFFFDFQSYWGRHLADVFGTTEQAIAQRAQAVALSLTGYDDDAEPQDPRRSAGVFDERGSYPDHRSWPREEDFSFYSAVHALLAVAAELGQHARAHKEPESAEDAYTEWLNEFLPKRRDGRWLSDRRDAPPSPAPERRLAKHTTENWRWSISASDFDKAAGHGTDWVMVRAAYDTSLGELSEDVNISSAFIPHNTARAYLIALQTSPLGGHMERLPTTDDSDHRSRVADGPFRLTAWLDASHHYEAVDRDDERGRNVTFPPTRPGTEIVRRFNLVADPDYRTWQRDGRTVFRTRVWDATEQRHSDYRTGTQGETLEVDAGFLADVLRELDQTLVLQVDLKRDVHRRYYRRKEDSDDFDWVEWSSKVYLIGPDGQWTEY